ncbi:MAG: HAMP domain-containing protein [Kofleriaceae bacterium]|nr:HAMP domain-containing protein [Kofleriaceae bacterium]
MTLSLRTRMLAGYVALVVLVGGATLWVINRSLADVVTGSLDARLEAQARGVAQWLAGAGHPERLAPRLARVVAAQVTIVGADGAIDGDSVGGARAAGRPVGDAPEIAAAMRGDIRRARRRLTDDGPMMYLVAVPTVDGGAVRIAVPLSAIDAARGQLRDRVAVAALVGLAAAVLLGLGAIRAVTRPLKAMTQTAERLARGEYDVPPPDPGQDGRDELGLLSRTLAQLAAEIRARVGELTAERDLSAAVVEGLVEGVVAVDRGGAVVLANRAAHALLGADVAMPGPLSALVDDARGGVDRDGELAIAGREVRVSARPLAATGGAIVVLYDVTQLRALEGVRRDFLASAAHELRTPVTAISGYAETLLGGGVDDASAQEFLATIHRNAGRIARLVDDLLTLERLEARPERIGERSSVALAAVARDAAATARAVTPTASITVAIDDDLLALADRDGLDHVVQNLIDNAVLHGGGVVRVDAHRVGKRVVLAVADDGPGIAAAHQARIFDRFYRVEAGKPRRGSGLGLAIVRQQVEALGGTIRVDSAPGQGATFVVELDAA